MNRFRLSLLAAVAGLSISLTPVLASAEEHFSHHEFHGRDVRQFRGRDFEVWHGGHWAHEWRNGRFGWWWFAGGVWYFYDAPVYPYPLAVSEVTYIEPGSAPPPPVGAAAPVYYYCDSPAGYYPYVATCTMPFRPVPAAPPPPVSPPPPPPAR